MACALKRPIKSFIASYFMMLVPVFAQEGEIPINDLGIKAVGDKSEITLLAKNVNCEAPIDFEFFMDNLPWLSTEGPPVAKALSSGQSKSIPAKLDFSYTQPGTHYGRITARCTSCGWYLFANCMENAQDVVLKVTIADEEGNAPTGHSANPYTGLRPVEALGLGLNPGITNDDRRLLDRDDKRALDSARASVEKAERDGKNAQSKFTTLQKQKSDCQRELARLRFEMEAANTQLAQAKETSRKAKDVAKAADKAFRNYARDERKALRAIERSVKQVEMGAAYRSIVREEDGTGTQRYKEAQEQVDRFNDEHFETLREHREVKTSYDARKAAAEKAASDAEAAERAVGLARQASATAKAAYERQLRICAGISEQLEDAGDELETAKDNAKKAVIAANKAEAKAAKEVSKKLDDKIKDKIDDCARQRKDAEKIIADLTKALDAAKKLKIISDDGGKNAGLLKKINDKIWDEAEDMAKDKVAAGEVATPGSLSKAKYDDAEDVLEGITGAMSHAADALSARLGGNGVPDFFQGELLGGLKVIGLAAQSLVGATRSPNSNWAQRDEELRGDNSYTRQKMKELKIGRNRKEREVIENNIKRLHNNPNLIAETIEQNARKAAQCVADLRALRGQQDEVNNKR